MKLILALAALLLVAPAAQAAPGLALYTLDCGLIRQADADVFADDGAYKGQAKELIVPCYLIRHPKGDLLWETGVPQAIADLPGGKGPEGVEVKRKLTDQLKQLGLAPADIEYLSVSHSHFDHIGNGGLFAKSTWIVHARERAHAFRPTARADKTSFGAYAALESAKTITFDGEAAYDVFDDGSVQIVPTPGQHGQGRDPGEIHRRPGGAGTRPGRLRRPAQIPRAPGLSQPAAEVRRASTARRDQQPSWPRASSQRSLGGGGIIEAGAKGVGRRSVGGGGDRNRVHDDGALKPFWLILNLNIRQTGLLRQQARA
ncbi:MAG: MBL fold metallo-hydrolase [Phenylobacterium sp.]|uniref:MBL fold metallo-hydrolase n=1 Tax=Phenylobacterium sp. TaxID=1871053 RepID=UPI002722FFAB|nr:MBL fold metallo-hydrolase [Phenylobacterium sp.]MDO8913366.1 MBL fold metallo-hydrolase [Phenylobacterium sp.]MDP3101893.1 MBL fold metallo-hydrolase [Phenylobacterium sp.]